MQATRFHTRCYGLRRQHQWTRNWQCGRNVSRQHCKTSATTTEKIIWVQTDSKDVFTSAVENGISCFAFRDSSSNLIHDWQRLASFKAVVIQEDKILDAAGQQIGVVCNVDNKDELQNAEKIASTSQIVLMEAKHWKVIPAENLVAVFQTGPAQLIAAAESASDARLMLEALELGTSGVLLKSNDAAEVRQLVQYVRQRQQSSAGGVAYEEATVTRVAPVGMGDRVCVDLASLMKPGEGMLVGCFARSLFLVHSECEESAYINSRPFRVNAGPVHSYVQAGGGKTAYLSELSCGAEVLIADAAGRQRTAIVGRAKIESRPLVLVEAATSDGQSHSILLQNAETVKLVGPPATHPPPTNNTPSHENNTPRPEKKTTRPEDMEDNVQSNQGLQGRKDTQSNEGMQSSSRFRTISVSSMVPGDKVLLYRQDGARHTGIKISESIVEK